MKKLFFLCAILTSTLSFGQVPEGFNVININDADSALVLFTKAAKQQSERPAIVDVTKDYIAQTRESGKRNLMTMNSRTVVVPKTIYYENITKVVVGKGWKIIFFSSITKVSDRIVVKDKEMAEKAYAALLCLIRNSSGNHYDLIINPPPKEKNKVQKLFDKKEENNEL